MGARVVVDLQAVQSRDFGERGIGRYVAEMARAVEAAAPGRVHAYTLNPRATAPGVVEPLVATGRVRWLRARDLDDLSRGPVVFHATCPFEMRSSLDDLWPPAVRRRDAALAVTLYDLIPLREPGRYLAEPGERARYLGRLQLVRSADVVLAISERTARDAVELLGVAAGRIRVVGGGASAAFRPPVAPRDEVARDLRRDLPFLRPGFVLCTGGLDPRKNLEGLVDAYAALPPALRRAHQLVLACHAGPGDEARLMARAAAAGAPGEVYVTGYVPDAVIQGLTQAAALSVFPSFYEGFGLPVAEALACGTPALVADTSSMPELVGDPEMRFDPRDVGAMTRAMARALGEPGFRARLQAHADRRGPELGWDRVAGRVLDAYAALEARLRTRRPRRRPRIALVTPLPPEPSPAAAQNALLLGHLAGVCDVDPFVTGDVHAARRAGAPALALADLGRVGRLTRYDRLVCCLDGRPVAPGVLDALARVAGDVLVHELTAPDPDEGPAAPHLPSGVPAAASRVLVYTRTAGELVRLQCEAAGVDPRVELVPAPFPRLPPAGPEPGGRDGGRWLVAFGAVRAHDRPEVLLHALAEVAREQPDARLALVGPIDPDVRDRLQGLAVRLDVGPCLTTTGVVPGEEYVAWIRRATVALQLGGTGWARPSSTLAECMAGGVPSVAELAGWALDLPEGVIEPVPAGAGAPAVAAAALRLLGDDGRRRRIAAAAGEHAAANAYDVLAPRIAAVLAGREGPP